MNSHSILIGGKAGDGINQAGLLIARIFTHLGYCVYMYYDYPSLIRGGHNFSVISTSPRWISSHYMKANLVVNLDKRSYETHIDDIVNNGIIILE